MAYLYNIIIIFIYTAQIQRTFSNAPYNSKSFTILKSNLQFFHQIKSNQMLVFEERGKPEYPEKNLSEQSREPTNSTHIWCRVQESNPGHIGGKRALSPLRQPCSPSNTFCSLSFSQWLSMCNLRSGVLPLFFVFFPFLFAKNKKTCDRRLEHVQLISNGHIHRL